MWTRKGIGDFFSKVGSWLKFSEMGKPGGSNSNSRKHLVVFGKNGFLVETIVWMITIVLAEHFCGGFPYKKFTTQVNWEAEGLVVHLVCKRLANIRKLRCERSMGLK